MRVYIYIETKHEAYGSTWFLVGYRDSEEDAGRYHIDRQIPKFRDENGVRKVVSALNQQMRSIESLVDQGKVSASVVDQSSVGKTLGPDFYRFNDPWMAEEAFRMGFGAAGRISDIEIGDVVLVPPDFRVDWTASGVMIGQVKYISRNNDGETFLTLVLPSGAAAPCVYRNNQRVFYVNLGEVKPNWATVV